jgi:hypothetical protein
MNEEPLPGFTPGMQMLGSVELNEIQARLINKHAHTILTNSLAQAVHTFKVIFDREPDEQDMLVFSGLCEYVVAGNKLEGRPANWNDVLPQFRPKQ